MPAKKPTTTLRRAKKPTTAREQNVALERAARKHQHPHRAVEEVAPPRGVVKRTGRAYANGTVTPAGELRRLTVYIPLDLFDELEARARGGRHTLSRTTAEVLADAFGVELQAVG
jgi:prolyl-tRNA editing enzyme YbaK/EbsC (Cys-tRNA(Pro) deacylase)